MKKLEPLRKVFKELLDQVEFHNVDLDQRETIESALTGADYVVHTASPVGANPKDHQEMIRPAVNGVRFVVEAACKLNIKRVVLTSSVSAVSCMADKDRPTEGKGYDESCWSDCEAYHFQAYTKSKTYAEKAAWDILYQKTFEKEFCPEIVTICPSFILGEVIGAGEQTSASIVKKMLNNEIPGWPNIRCNYVDVKDVALAHIRGLERPDAANKRFIISKETGHAYVELALMLEKSLKETPYDYSIRTMTLPKWMVKIGGVFSNDLESICFLIDEPPRVMINERSR